MRQEAQEDHGTRSRGQLETTRPRNSSWMPHAPQEGKGFDDDDDEREFILIPTKLIVLLFFFYC
jgi:hypothetical protein